MDNQIKVSVIIPVYNAAEHINQCLDSVVGQTLQEIEIICVDDGSTDGSGNILEEYQERDTRVKVYHQQNRFAGCARNLGLRNAVGKYIIFWDSDDFFELDALEKLYQKCEEDQAEIGVCGGKRMDNISGVTYSSGVYVVKKMLPEIIPFSRKEIPQFIFNFTTNVPWNKMFLREFVLKHQLEFQPLRQANDVYFSMVALFLSERITVIPEPLVTYRMDNTHSLTGRASDNRYCTMEAYEAVWKKLNQYPEFDEPMRQSFANRTLDALMYSLRTQWDFQAYQELFSIYKEQLFAEFGILGQEADYFYSEQKYRDLQQILRSDAQTYLLYDFRNYERRFRDVSGQLSNTKQSLKELKKENKHLNKRLEKLSNSSSYKVGKGILYLPGKAKAVLKKVIK